MRISDFDHYCIIYVKYLILFLIETQIPQFNNRRNYLFTFKIVLGFSNLYTIISYRDIIYIFFFIFHSIVAI